MIIMQQTVSSRVANRHVLQILKQLTPRKVLTALTLSFNRVGTFVRVDGDRK